MHYFQRWSDNGDVCLTVCAAHGAEGSASVCVSLGFRAESVLMPYMHGLYCSYLSGLSPLKVQNSLERCMH